MKAIKFLDTDQREQIGFSYIIEQLETITPYGTEEKKNIRPFKRNEKKELISELDELLKVSESIENNKYIYRDIERIFYKIKDIRNSVLRCKNLNILDDIELFEIKHFSLLIEEIIEVFRGAALNLESIKFHSLEGLVTLLDPEEKRIPTFYIYDKYSEKLKNIREHKKKIEEEIIKEKDDNKAKLLKEERLKIVILEENEELIIRKKLTESIRGFSEVIETNISSIGRLDFLIAKSKLYYRFKGIKPTITDDMNIRLYDIYNPSVAEVLETKGKSFTPISIQLASGSTIITGANMGGKSVALKTIILNMLLAQCGFFVFAKEAVLPVMDFIYFISDDLQSVSQGLSTFGAEIIKLKEIVENAKHQIGFIALDEFARGTNPREGSFLVKSVVKYLRDLKSISIISTHYDGAADESSAHYQVAGLKGVNFDALKYKIDLNKKYSVEIIQEHMDYRLEKVSKEKTVPEDALNICILLGLEEEIINIAKDYYKGK